MPDIAGLKLIVPTSVAGSGVSVSASGKVSFTSATTINVNGVFSSTYDNYLVVTQNIDTSTSNVDLNGRLRVGGVDAAGSNYTDQYIYADSTTVAAARQSSRTEFRFAVSSNTTRNGSHTYFYGPALAQPTAMRCVCAQGTSSARIVDDVATHSLSTAYDGFSLILLSSGITGSLCVYGLAQ